MNLALGRRIRELRLAKGLTLRGLAQAIGVSAPFLVDLEHGRRSTERLSDIARVLGADPDELAALAGRVDPELRKVNGEASWFANPFVWVVSFRRL